MKGIHLVVSLVLAFVPITAAAQTGDAQPPPTDDKAAPTGEAPQPVADAPAEPAVPSGKLQVYTKPIEPFSFQRDGKDLGFALDLWARIADKLGMEYELHWEKTVGDVIDNVKSGKGDVGIAAISITSEREKSVEFTTPYYESGLAILARAQGKGIGDLMKETFWTKGTAKGALVILILLVICAHLVWFFERRNNAEQFPQPYAKGLWESSWWAISTILSGGCDAKGPNHILGRLFGAIWMLTCIIVITYFTAAITTVMTVSSLQSDINGPDDLPGKEVATVKGSTAEKYLTEHGVKVHAFPTIDEAFASMDKKDVVAVVYDEPILAYHVKTAGAQGQTVVGLFERQNYGIALQPGSPLRKQINTVLLELAEEGVIDELRAKWFGAN